MTGTGVFLSSTTLSGLSKATRAEIAKVVALADDAPTPAKSAKSTAESATAATEFSVNEMRKFISGVSDKTRHVLTAVARAEARFNVGAVLSSIGLKPEDIRGVLAGITKRSRTISGNSDAEFFAAVNWDDDVNKQISEVHPTTHAALRALLLKK